MNNIWIKVREYGKTIAAFVAGVVVSVGIKLFKGELPWPQNGSEWGQLALSSFGPALATWITTNKITQKQLDKDPNVIGGVVVSDAQVPPPAVGSISVRVLPDIPIPGQLPSSWT